MLRDSLLSERQRGARGGAQRRDGAGLYPPRQDRLYRAQEQYRYIPESGPQFYFNIGSLEKFQTDYEQTQAEIGLEQHTAVPSLTFRA